MLDTIEAGLLTIELMRLLFNFLALWMARPMYHACDTVFGMAYCLITFPVKGVAEMAMLSPRSTHCVRNMVSTREFDSAFCHCS